MLQSGIYCIKSIINDKVYIGHSTDIQTRWGNHKTDLRGNRHGNIKLQNYINKYGIDTLEFLILENINHDEKLDVFLTREVFWISLFNSIKKGFNIDDPSKQLGLPYISRAKRHFWINLHTKEEFYASRYELALKIKVNPRTLIHVVNGRHKTSKGWSLKNRRIENIPSLKKKEDQQRSYTFKNLKTGEIVTCSFLDFISKYSLHKDCMLRVVRKIRLSFRGWTTID